MGMEILEFLDSAMLFNFTNRLRGKPSGSHGEEVSRYETSNHYHCPVFDGISFSRDRRIPLLFISKKICIGRGQQTGCLSH
jgi:hypothetical protein